MEEPVPARVREYADQTVEYVHRALGIRLEFDSDTLPVLDHYLRTVPEGQAATIQLVVATSGAYFGEVVRRRLGGRWEAVGDDTEWRVVLPTGLNFSPAGIVASAIAMADLDDLDSEIDAPPRMRPYVQQALQRMGEVSVEDYYSLCGRLDTLEHLHEVLVAVAAQMMGNAADLDEGEAGEAADAPAAPPGDAPEPIFDEQSGRVN
ncbi:MAG: hypothetical protein KF773_18510 [Deltaproteobacteria bacterium]|nr:hypothetical protein [Deltaproteobacteria bacterium]MCW5807469.1 hypothetical protein [Deltaproteobacteria bacterium]